MSPTVTAIAQPIAELGRRVVDVLIRVFAGRSAKSVLPLASSQVRESPGGGAQHG